MIKSFKKLFSLNRILYYKNKDKLKFRILEENELNLTNIEKSQLINLLPQKAEEAFALIPSLANR